MSVRSILWMLFYLSFLLAGGRGLVAAEFERPMQFANLPEGISSFGAAVAGDHLYVFGGHVGRIPGNSRDSLSPHFVRLDLREPGSAFESLPMHNSSQSPAIVAWKGNIYRVGGLSFDNRQGEETVYHSLDEFSKFDTATKTWVDLPKLPKPRSSLDAAVVYGKVYVVGGWDLQGTDVMDAPWHEDALVFDLSNEKGEWKSIAKPPFVKRGLAVAAHGGKVWVLGGMTRENKITPEVHSYDPPTDQWTEGPNVKGRSEFAAFAISAFSGAGRLCYTGTDGTLFWLDEKSHEWVADERLLYPRSFLRLVAREGGNDKTLYAVAGISRSAYVATIETITLSDESKNVAKLAEWTLPLGGDAKVVQGQVTLLNGNMLYAFGGNASRNPHDFSKEAIVAEAYRFDLATRTVETLPPLPQAVQSGAAFLAGERIDQSIYLLGGISNPGDKYQSADTIHRYRLRSKNWTDEIGHLPGPRSMFSIVTHDNAAWIFGGSQVTGHGGGLIADSWQWTGSLEEPAQVVAEAAIPTPRRSFGAAVLGGKMYAVGGLGEESKIVDKVDVYDFEAKTWTTIPSPDVSRVFPSVAAAGGKLYLSGGFARVDGHFQKVESVEAYDPKTGAWSVAFDRLPFDSASRTMFEYHDRLLFYGLDSEKTGIAHFALLDPAPQSPDYGAEPTRAGGGGSTGGGSGELVARLMRMDRNKDGKLTKEEVGERFRPLIERADADKDGFATKEELAASADQGDRRGAAGPFTAGGGFGNPARMVNRVLEENDANKDDALTEGEIPERLKANVEKIDTNKDGKLDKKEVETWFESRAAERPMRGGGERTGRRGGDRSDGAPARPAN